MRTVRGQTALHFASFSDRCDIASLLIHEGANIHAKVHYSLYDIYAVANSFILVPASTPAIV